MRDFTKMSDDELNAIPFETLTEAERSALLRRLTANMTAKEIDAAIMEVWTEDETCDVAEVERQLRLLDEVKRRAGGNMGKMLRDIFAN